MPVRGGALVGNTHRRRIYLRVALKVVAVASSIGRGHIADGGWKMNLGEVAGMRGRCGCRHFWLKQRSFTHSLGPRFVQLYLIVSVNSRGRMGPALVGISSRGVALAHSHGFEVGNDEPVQYHCQADNQKQRFHKLEIISVRLPTINTLSMS
jgi:hypothetical protein